MAFQQIAGLGAQFPDINNNIQALPSFSTATIDATGEQVAFVGPVWFKERTGTKDIRKVGFRFGTVTKAGGSGLTVSLQTVSATALQPDGTPDETVAIATGDAGFVTNAWYQTGNLSADRTVAYGEMLAVVIEYDGSGRLGADTVGILGLAAEVAGPFHKSSTVLFTASWATTFLIPNVILEFSDGTFGTLAGGFPCSAVGTLTYNSGSTPDENALKINTPFPWKADSFGGIFGAMNVGDSETVLYEGTSAMSNATRANDKDHMLGSSRFLYDTFDAEVGPCAINTDYYLSIKPGASNVVLNYFDVAAAGHLQAHGGGEGLCLASRTNAGAWSTTTTRRPFLWVYLSSLDDGAGGSGTTIAGTPLMRGMVG
jgi:hypothetical protein